MRCQSAFLATATCPEARAPAPPGPPARKLEPEVRRERTAEVVALLVELERRAQSEEPPSFRGLPRRDVELALRKVERAGSGRLAPADVSASTVDVIRHLLGRPRTAPRGQAVPPTGSGLDAMPIR